MSAHWAITEELTERLVSAFSRGFSQQLAADYAGIAKVQVQRWIDAADDETVPESVRAMCCRLKTARAEAAAKWADKLDKCSHPGLWQKWAWRLERSHPESFGAINRNQIEQTVTHRFVLDDVLDAHEQLQASRIKALPTVTTVLSEGTAHIGASNVTTGQEGSRDGE